MRKYVSALFVVLFLISIIGAAYSATITTQAPVNLKPEEEQQVTNNMTLIVYPDQAIELRMLHEETPGPENGSIDLSFEFIKENETYSGISDMLIEIPEEELGIFENISSLSFNGSYVDRQLSGMGVISFVPGLPVAEILFKYNISEERQEYTIEMESFLPLINGEKMSPFQIPPSDFANNITYMIDQFNSNPMMQGCTLEIIESTVTNDSVFVAINVTTEEDFMLGKFTGTTNVSAFFNSGNNYLKNITITGLWEGEGNAKFQFEIFVEFNEGVPSKATVNILLTDSADEWSFTTEGEVTFENDPFFALTSLDIMFVLEGNATEVLSDLNNILMKMFPPEEETPPIDEIIEFQSDIFEALSAVEIEELSFEFSYANGQISFESSFELSGNLDDALAEAKDIWLDFVAEMDPNVTEELWYQFLGKTDLRPEYIRLEVQQSSAGITETIILKKIDTEVVGNATVFRYPLLFEALNESEHAETATLKIVGGENKTHRVFLDIPGGIPEPMEQTDRYAIWNITEDFDMVALGEVKFLSIQVVYPVVVGEQEVEIEVVANVTGVTITNVSYESGFTTLGTTKGLKFTVSGPSGTIATVNITIPKDVVPKGAQLTVYVGDEQVPATIIETETEYIIMVTVHFSEVIIYVEFTTPVERYLFAIIGGVVVLLLIIIAASTLLKKKK